MNLTHKTMKTKQNVIKIVFCTKCGWLTRSTWMAQEILITLTNDIDSLSLVPSDGGRFEIWCNDQLIFSRAAERKFIEIKEIKVRIRNLIDPHRPLGHNDTIKKI